MALVLGIDAGGSKTVALLADGEGKVLERASGSGANLQVHGEQGVEATLRDLLAELGDPPVDAVCLGMAGAGRPGDRHVAEAVLGRLGLSCPVRVLNDAYVALVAGAPERRGIVVVSGTGSLAFGVDGDGGEARSGGWGHLLGDEGSAYWLGHAAVRRGIRAADGRGPETLLGPKILEHLELARPNELVAWFYDQDSSRQRVAWLAPLVEAAADEGDDGANELLDEAALHLARAARSVATQLDLGSDLPLVLAGGAFKGCPSLERRLASCLDLENVSWRNWVSEPAQGAVTLALDLARMGPQGSAMPADATLETSTEGSHWASLATEATNPASQDLDTLSTVDVVTLLINEDRDGLRAALGRRSEIARLAGWVAETIEGGGHVRFAGAGTSGRLGVLEAAECPPTFGTDPDLIQAVMAGGQGAVFKAVEGAEDVSDDGALAVADLGRLDLVIGISASSVTPYALGALTAARASGARTALITCADRSGLEEAADLVIGLATGPEVLTGSTRLKAGSATKAVLNAVTTAAMVRLGKTYGHWMVDLRPGSAKLEDRAERIVAAVCSVSSTKARSLLRDANGVVKVALVVGKAGVSTEEAVAALGRSGGRVREALEGL